MARKFKEHSQRRPNINVSPVRLIYIFTEGSITELEYFKLLRDHLDLRFHIRGKFALKLHPSDGKSSPKNIKNKIVQTLNSLEAPRLAECWVLLDKDNWPNDQICELKALGNKFKTLSRYEVLVSEPKFEIWLLYHFSEAKGVATDKDVDREIKKHIPGYNKHISNVTRCFENLERAIELAKQRYEQKAHAKTCVFKLCEYLLTLARN